METLQTLQTTIGILDDAQLAQYIESLADEERTLRAELDEVSAKLKLVQEEAKRRGERLSHNKKELKAAIEMLRNALVQTMKAFIPL